ncbi:hypothetical protein [Sphingomicrobium nitratireducens]|uniref:hypothetical protein n=1 Tax=Sphingomicrobium nitratireducens TaxID=2964666 RepID=UPI00223FAA9C|nr:hypothetical protein [Sphingomicrobium nitratireducens]
MSDARLLAALERARQAAARIESALAARPAENADASDDALRRKLGPILADLDRLLADAEGH